MNKLYAVTSTDTVGVTFLDWSIHWLTGASKYYNIDHGWLDLVASPLSKDINAHQHQKNHPAGFEQCLQAVNLLKQVDGIVSMYPCPAHTEQILNKINIDKTEFANQQLLVVAEQQKDYLSIWNLLQEQNISTIYLNFKDSLYLQVVRNLDVGLVDQYKSYQSKLDYYKDFTTTFFKKGLVSTEIWDYRELLALSIRPFKHQNIDQLIDFKKPHLYINAEHLFYNGLSCIINSINYLGLTVDYSKIPSWLIEYKKWQEIQFDTLKFSWDFEHICNCIVNNYYYDMSNYKLDLMQEAIILHILLYKHGVNIKAYGLEKLPNNTQEIHRLLEKNITHKLENIYL